MDAITQNAEMTKVLFFIVISPLPPKIDGERIGRWNSIEYEMILLKRFSPIGHRPYTQYRIGAC